MKKILLYFPLNSRCQSYCIFTTHTELLVVFGSLFAGDKQQANNKYQF